jgi:N-acyl-D-aspartate/D-glutamate deacylase
MQATVGPGLFFDELAGLARSTGRTVTWTALLAGMLGPGSGAMLLERSVELIRQGLPVVPQVSCRPLNFEFQWKAPFPFESLAFFQPVSAADHEGKKRLYADAEFRRAFRERGTRGGIAGRWEDTVIADCAVEPALAERNVAMVAAERGVHPVDLVLDLALATDLAARFRMAVMNTDEAAVAELLTHPTTVLGLSDAGAHASQLCDAPFATHLLAHWVRTKGVLTLAQAVHLLTARSAALFGLRDRGRLAPGLAADVTVFDPATIGCSPLRRVRDQPAGADRLIADATGIRAVVVNGVVLREDGHDALDPTGPLPGQVLRGGRS